MNPSDITTTAQEWTSLPWACPLTILQQLSLTTVGHPLTRLYYVSYNTTYEMMRITTTCRISEPQGAVIRRESPEPLLDTPQSRKWAVELANPQ